MLEDFKKFVLRGNVVDLAIAVVIGVAFGAIVSSLVADIIMPIIGAITGGLDFSNNYLTLSGKVQQGAAYADAKKMGADDLAVSSHQTGRFKPPFLTFFGNCVIWHLQPPSVGPLFSHAAGL
jgi:hypothetical protein